MLHLRHLLLLLPLAALLLSGPAVAGIIDPGTYQLLDHGDGNLGPHYGLRLDAIGEVFSFELDGAFVELIWDGGNTATISGDINQNTLGGNGGVGPLWVLDYLLTGVVAVGTQGFTASAGTGTLTDPFDAVTSMIGKQDGGGIAFRFLADGHRLAGDSDSPVGRGWLLPPGSTDDFLVRAVKLPAVKLPEPGSALLLAALLAGLASVHRRSPARLSGGSASDGQRVGNEHA